MKSNLTPLAALLAVPMRTRPFALLAATAAVGLAVTGTGIATAIASPRHETPTATRTGTEYVEEMSTAVLSPKAQVIIYGMFTAAGTDTIVGSTDHLKFPGGTFEAVQNTTGIKVKAHPGTCVSTVIFTITYKLDKGTGEFAGISGSGHATATILNIAAPAAHGGCSTTKFIASQKLVEASGPVAMR
jgi:hypothetical protein